MIDNLTKERARHLCMISTLTRLQERGVCLREKFPVVYAKLAAYAETGREFSPVTLFPRDGDTGRTFMCLIIPNAEPGMETLAAFDQETRPVIGTKI